MFVVHQHLQVVDKGSTLKNEKGDNEYLAVNLFIDEFGQKVLRFIPMQFGGEETKVPRVLRITTGQKASQTAVLHQSCSSHSAHLRYGHFVPVVHASYAQLI